MKIFSKRTNPQIQTIEQLIERQTRLTFMRSEAQVALDAALADRQGHLVGGDFEDESIAEAMQVRADKAQAALVGLDDAIAALTIQIGNAQEAQTAELRRIKAESDAKELAAVVSKVEKLLPAWIATARGPGRAVRHSDKHLTREAPGPDGGEVLPVSAESLSHL